MLKRGVETEILAYCAANDIGVVAYSPLRSGILTDGFSQERLEAITANDWRQRDPDFQEPRAQINLDFVEKLRAVAASVDLPLAQLATAWVIARPEVTSAIVGARRPKQIESSAPAGDLQLSPETMEQIEMLLAERDRRLEEAGAFASESLR